MRGGTSTLFLTMKCAPGLSPLARGHLYTIGSICIQTRSIPACAGAPSLVAGIVGMSRVYPRLRGGTPCRATQRAHMIGLSPLARGHQPLRDTIEANRGSIPACAGAPGGDEKDEQQTTVYPRLRGGTENVDTSTPAGRGLSPLARGHLLDRRRAARVRGSIPACAGAPGSARDALGVVKVYPRLRGGTFRHSCAVPKRQGLSPLARGHRLRFTDPVFHRRSIPACAGAPPRASASFGGGRVYPRLRGGTCVDAALERLPDGLSPLARGHPGAG